jgi:siroheme synthase-like protein
MRYFPIFLDLAGKPVLLVGGGEVAARKFSLLSEARAVVTVTARHSRAEPLRTRRAGLRARTSKASGWWWPRPMIAP